MSAFWRWVRGPFGGDPLADAREWTVAALLFAVVAFTHTRHAVDWLHPATTVQTRDSLLAAVIMAHVGRAAFGVGENDFWDFPIYWPERDGLCYSDPMLLQGLATAPFVAAFGWPFAHNVFVWTAWFATGLGAWAMARGIGCGRWASLWAGAFVACSPDRSFHIAGHAHLFFQAMFGFAPLAMLRAFRPAASRAWGLAAGGALLVQALTGFYLTLIFAPWAALVLPAAAWEGCGRSRAALVAALRRQGLAIAIPAAAGAAILLGLAGHYSRATREVPHATFEMLAGHSATFQGYATPSSYGDAGILAGRLFPADRIRDRIEDGQYLGISGALAVLAAIAAGIVGAARRRVAIVAAAAAVAGLAGFVLSFGPLSRPGEGGVVLPFGWIYAHVEQVRFFRAPARFAFVVEWGIAVVGALALSRGGDFLRRRVGRWAASAVGMLALATTFFEFLPVGDAYRIRVPESPFATWLRESGDRSPLLEVPAGTNEFMARLGWHGVPSADGFSGYAPPGRIENLEYFSANFPAPEALAVMAEYRVRRVFVTRHAKPEQREAARDAGTFRILWEGDEGIFAELVDDPPTLESIAGARRTTEPRLPPLSYEIFGAGSPGRPLLSGEAKLWIGDMEREGSSVFRSPGPNRPMAIRLPPGGLPTAAYSTLRLRARIDPPFPMRETVVVYWQSQARSGLDEGHVLRYPIPADGEFHVVRVPLGRAAAWVADAPATALVLHVGIGGPMEIEIDDLALER